MGHASTAYPIKCSDSKLTPRPLAVFNIIKATSTVNRQPVSWFALGSSAHIGRSHLQELIFVEHGTQGDTDGSMCHTGPNAKSSNCVTSTMLLVTYGCKHSIFHLHHLTATNP